MDRKGIKVPFLFCLFLTTVKSGIESIEILCIQLVVCETKCFSETLEMHDLPRTQEFDYIVDIRVIRQPKDIIIGHSGFLLCCNRINTTISKTENSGNRERLLCRKPLCCPSVSMRLFVYNKAKNIIERFLFL